MNYLITFILSVSFFTAYSQHDHIVPATAEFQVKGLVKNKLTFHINDILRFKQDELGDIVIRNKKGEEKGTAVKMKGVLLKTFLDSAGITADKPKEYSEFYIVLTASDGYKNVYSWNELFNSDLGNHVYIITSYGEETMEQMPDRILVMSLGDTNSGRRHLKGLASIEVKRVE